MKIAFGSDHAGFRLKQEIMNEVAKMGHELLDFGTVNEDSVDYPDYAMAVAEAVSSGRADLGILVCGTGLGMAIAANKVPGVRAVTCSDTFSARASREHNNANVLCLGARVLGAGLAKEIVSVWLSSSFQGGRHQKRVDKILEMERRYLRYRQDVEGA